MIRHKELRRRKAAWRTSEEAMFLAVYKYLLATDELSEHYPVCLRMCSPVVMCLVVKRGIIQVKQVHGTNYQKLISLFSLKQCQQSLVFYSSFLPGQFNAETASVPAADTNTPGEAWVNKKTLFGYVQLVVMFYVLAT